MRTLPLTSAAPAIAGLPPRFACFVTGTDTEIGKTLTSSALLHALVKQGVRACGMKPVAAGAEIRDGELHNEDADQLRHRCGNTAEKRGQHKQNGRPQEQLYLTEPPAQPAGQ
eukprot:gene44620-55521_t